MGSIARIGRRQTFYFCQSHKRESFVTRVLYECALARRASHVIASRVDTAPLTMSKRTAEDDNGTDGIDCTGVFSTARIKAQVMTDDRVGRLSNKAAEYIGSNNESGLGCLNVVHACCSHA